MKFNLRSRSKIITKLVKMKKARKISNNSEELNKLQEKARGQNLLPAIIYYLKVKS